MHSAQPPQYHDKPRSEDVLGLIVEFGVNAVSPPYLSIDSRVHTLNPLDRPLRRLSLIAVPLVEANGAADYLGEF